MEKKIVHWIVDLPAKTACKFPADDDLCCMALTKVTCKKCLNTKEAKEIRRTKMSREQKSEQLEVHVVLDGNCIDRVYLNRKAARKRELLLIRQNSHLPTTHYNIEKHKVRGLPEKTFNAI